MTYNPNIMPLNEKMQRHGYWERYRVEGSLWFKRTYQNGIKVGYEEWHRPVIGAKNYICDVAKKFYII